MKQWKRNGNINQKSKNVQQKIWKLFTSQKEKVIKLFHDYSKIASMAKYRPIHGEGLKILIPKQMLQTLSILLVQVKGGNRSENLLSKIRQVMYSLYKAKEIAKKVCNNIMTSIKL